MSFCKRDAWYISIHAPHAGGDRTAYLFLDALEISIHAPHAGGDPCGAGSSFALFVFQSTPPMQGATRCHRMRARLGLDFNPRPPCRGRPDKTMPFTGVAVFQSTPPMQGATRCHRMRARLGLDFNPRPPCRGRPDKTMPFTGVAVFQSTPPMQGATSDGLCSLDFTVISIHAPHAGGDGAVLWWPM